ncbi:WXG100 family type VII secretion target [Agromyces aerolatus]|uniref:WXG100 family type VII secretion target n=1 Tax=Agromyces sp. LY-1074 TaxID=3074080 RepID=UPI002865989E|nr:MULTISPECIES: hypothetical protein [unclassified Agromyces]MDR5698424.1 hypothetical protein [Agromyces sp. LY-1074]MDR5704718.1 hypothetical protein [Agromyces sp. LY-1358]
MVSFRVRAAALSEVSALLGTVLSTFDTNLSTVDAQVKGTVDVTWRGEDADSFAEGWATFMSTAGFVRQSLASLQAGLIAADGSYTTNESSTQRSFTGRVQSVASIKATSGSLGAKVSRGEERADDIAEFFGRDEEGGGSAAFLGGALGRPSAGQQSKGPADGDDADAEGTDGAEAGSADGGSGETAAGDGGAGDGGAGDGGAGDGGAGDHQATLGQPTFEAQPAVISREV